MFRSLRGFWDWLLIAEDLYIGSPEWLILYKLTCKSIEFKWTEECQSAFDRLKELLVTWPIQTSNKTSSLRPMLHTKVLGCVIPDTVQPDGRPHPIAYASRGLTPAKRNYGISDLETLAAVWSISHFHYYLYGHKVT